MHFVKFRLLPKSEPPIHRLPKMPSQKIRFFLTSPRSRCISCCVSILNPPDPVLQPVTSAAMWRLRVAGAGLGAGGGKSEVRAITGTVPPLAVQPRTGGDNHRHERVGHCQLVNLCRIEHCLYSRTRSRASSVSPTSSSSSSPKPVSPTFDRYHQQYYPARKPYR